MNEEMPLMFSPKDIVFSRTLGEGSFGRVALVYIKDEITDDPCYLALKMIKRETIFKTRSGDNLQREISILNEISGDSFFPKLYNTFVIDDRFCLLMDFCPGGELFSWIHRLDGFCVNQAKFYFAEILIALEKLHTRNIIYRDLKSENVLLTRSGHINLVDFGLAIRTLTPAYSSVGTKECMAPEIIKGIGYGKEADYWALGILLFEMVHVYTPFGDADSDDEIMKNILNNEVTFDKALDVNYVDLVEKLLIKDPKLRIGACGVEDIKNHPFFADIDWVQMELMNITPPLIPTLPVVGDSRYFEYYKESINSFETREHNLL